MPYRDKSSYPYTLAFKLPPDCQNLIASCYRKLSGVCEGFAAPNMAHVSVKYLGYPGPRFPESILPALISRIRELAHPFVPLKMSIRGMDCFENEHGEVHVVYLKVLPNQALQNLHETLLKGLGSAIDPFPHTDGENYRPHITLSLQIRPKKSVELRRIVHRSRKSAKRQFRLSQLGLLTPKDEISIIPPD